MRTACPIVVVLAASLLGGCGDEPGSSSEYSTETKPAREAPDQIGASENYALWSEYCVGDPDMTQRPVPNYDHPDVMSAALKLTEVSSHSFALYGDFNKHHKTDIPAELDGTVKKLALQFLVVRVRKGQGHGRLGDPPDDPRIHAASTCTTPSRRSSGTRSSSSSGCSCSSVRSSITTSSRNSAGSCCGRPTGTSR